MRAVPPSLPRVWDATSLAIETPGMTLRDVSSLADEVLGGAGFSHRTVALRGELTGEFFATDMSDRELAAVEASRAAGHELTFVSVDRDDWPRLLYAKLGFRAIGAMGVLRRAPA